VAIEFRPQRIKRRRGWAVSGICPAESRRSASVAAGERGVVQHTPAIKKKRRRLTLPHTQLYTAEDSCAATEKQIPGFRGFFFWFLDWEQGSSFLFQTASLTLL
jgi:hypothetical protein